MAQKWPILGVKKHPSWPNPTQKWQFRNLDPFWPKKAKFSGFAKKRDFLHIYVTSKTTKSQISPLFGQKGVRPRYPCLDLFFDELLTFVRTGFKKGPKNHSKTEKTPKTGFFHFWPFCQNRKLWVRNRQHVQQKPVFAPDPWKLPPHRYGGGGIFWGVQKWVQKWPIFGGLRTPIFRYLLTCQNRSYFSSNGYHFFGHLLFQKWVKSGSQNGTRFWDPQKVRIYNFSFRSTKNDPKIDFFHVFSTFGQKTRFFTTLKLKVGFHTILDIRWSKMGQKWAKKGPKQGSGKWAFFKTSKTTILNPKVGFHTFLLQEGAKKWVRFWPKVLKNRKITFLDPFWRPFSRIFGFFDTKYRP